MKVLHESILIDRKGSPPPPPTFVPQNVVDFPFSAPTLLSDWFLSPYPAIFSQRTVGEGKKSRWKEGARVSAIEEDILCQ